MSAPAADGRAGWCAAIVVPRLAVPALEEALALEGAAISSSEIPGGGNWRIEAYFVAEPGRSELDARLLAAARSLDMAVPFMELAPLPDVDWLLENRKSFAPLTVGRFFLHGRHDREQIKPGMLPLEIEAGRAFGTGRHETTQGCLTALQWLSRHVRPNNALDLGCGTGVLAMAMIRLWHRPVLASDIDPWAVRTARANAGNNELAPLLTAVRADGLNHPALRRRAPYDLIVANILARPLLAMAGPIAGALRPGGHLILSGLLAHQLRQITATYRGRGLIMHRCLQSGEWPTLLMIRQ